MVGSKKYAGNPYTCTNTFSVAGIWLGLILYFAGNPKTRAAFVYALPIPLFIIFLIFMIDMNYFIIDDGNLIIKNHYLPWKKRIIALTNINEFAIVKPYRRSKALRIYSKDLHSKRFCAGSLRENNWNALIKDLKHSGIPMKKYIYN
jgi:hypothetical protein